MTRRFHRSLQWLIGIGGSLLVIATWPALSRLVRAHPAALWVAMGAMLVAGFIVQYRRNEDQR